MKYLLLLLTLLALSAQAAVVPIQRTVFTTNTFDTDIVGGAMIYFDYPSGKFVATTTAYTNGIFYEPTIGFLSIVHTNSTGDALLNLSEGGPAGASVQGYADKFVVANTNLTLDAVGPYSIRLRVNGNNVLEAVAGSISLSGQTNLIADNGSALTYNGVPLSPATNLWASSGGVLSPSPAVNSVGVNNLSLRELPLGIQTFLSTLPNDQFAYITNVYTKNLPAGDNSILTVPSGCRFLPLRILVTPTNVIVNAWLSVSTNSVVTQLRPVVAVPTNGTVISFNAFVFEENETLIIHATTNLQRTAVVGLIYTNSIQLKSPRNFSLPSGDTTLYTVPANTSAIAYVTLANGVQHTLEYFNNTSATTVSRTLYVIPSGEVKDINSRLSVSSIAAQAQSPASFNPILFAGDSILLNLNTSASNQVAWITLWEQ